MSSSAISSSQSVVGVKRLQYCCSYCKRDISQQLRIHCAVCENFDLCGDCFSTGVSRFPHVNTHDYQVVDSLEVPLFTKDWTIREELALLEGIDKFGVGNWKFVSEFIGSKGLKQVEEHYWESYLGVHGYCLPCLTIIEDELVPTERFSAPINLESEEFKYSDLSESGTSVDLCRIPVMKGAEKGELVVRDRGKEAGRARDKADIIAKIALLPGRYYELIHLPTTSISCRVNCCFLRNR